MAVFYYKAKDKHAATVEGEIAANSQAEAVDRVSQMGLLPIAVVDKTAHSQLGSGRLSAEKPRGREVYFFTRQLFNLIKSGVSILRALELIAMQQKHRSFRTVIESIRLAIQQGRTLSEGLSQYPQIFSAFYVTMIKAGEESGNLKEVLSSLAEYQRSQQELLSKVRAALAYPLLMLVFGVGTVFFILTYVLPQIIKLFDSVSQSLPLPTIIVMQISAWLTDPRILFGLIFGALLGAWCIQNFLSSQKGQRMSGRWGLKMPVLGAFFLRVDLARFSRTCELLLKSGIPIVRAIKLAVPVVGNPIIREELLRCQDDLIAGKALGESLQQCLHIPQIVGYLIAVGEESGSLTTTFGDIGENYEQEIEEQLKISMTLLEPIMIIVVGGMIGFIIMAMLLPIFQMDILAS